MSSGAQWIEAKAQASLNPPQVSRALSAIASAWPGSLAEFLRSFPLGENALVHLLAVSSICAQRLERDPELLAWLGRPEISSADRGPRRMQAELEHNAGPSLATENFRALRRWKAREMTRLALREVASASSLEQTVAELSSLAEVCFRTVYRELTGEMRARFGPPQTTFTTLGLGKLGGRELNHSSDIDLIFVYGEEGKISPRLSTHDWHNRLVESMVKVFSASDEAGALFRIDLRLRPEGSAGPLTRSLESAEHYYAGFGETWERLALIKARRIGGSEELAYEFLRQLQPFIFPRSPTPELLDEIASIKRRIEREVPVNEWNVKLGAGGIREIEFIAQTLQFIHGSRHAFLQETSTLKVLRAIAQLELLPVAQVAVLDRAYRLLRRVEHRLQIEWERQIHSLPPEPEKRERLALSLGFAGADVFEGELRDAMQSVREIFNSVITARSETTATPQLDFFADPRRAERALAEIGQGSASFHVAPRTRQVFRKLRPLLIAELARSADPDQTLTGIVRFVEAFGLRSLLLELLVTNPKLLGLLVRTFDASEFATNLLIRHPNLLEEITRSAALDQPRSLQQHAAALTRLINGSDLLPVRSYRQAQLLRIVIRDVLGLAPLRVLLQEQTDLAEACLLAANAIAGSPKLTIVAMGKFGGRELGYGSDLDLMFVGTDHRVAQNLVGALTSPSAEGSIASVDLRLRPEGDKGPLIAPVAAFADYYRDRAQLWEIQALTRARVITGPQQAEFYQVAHATWSVAGRDPLLFARIDDMRERIRRERATAPDFVELKTGYGGIIAAEFLVQGLQMRHDVREPSTFRAIEKLSGIISTADAATLKRAYAALRHCELVLRRRQNTSESTIPESAIEQQRLAQRLGFANKEEWLEHYLAARGQVRDIYQRYLGPALQP